MITDKEKIELFDYMMANAHYTAERRPNGKRLLEITINCNNGNSMDKLIFAYYSYLRPETKTKEERYQEYIKLKEEFENDPI